MRAKRQHDGDQADSSERNWNGTFNEANECTARGGNSPAYDGPGNMTDDGVNYTYVYDVFGRLKTVKTRGGSPATVSEYTYNGLGHRIGWHYDADTDADVDGSDPWYWFFYDERWRMVATYRGSDSNPKERFVYHNAGAKGMGGSSYIDSVILRDSDESVGWTTAAPDSTLENRYYYLQNWRADVVALIQADGVPLEYVRYSAYGVPYVYSSADVNRDGVVDMDDVYAWDDYHDLTTGDAAVDIDINRDGSVNSTDQSLVTDIEAWGPWASSGRGFLSRLGSRKGYAGYEFDPATSQWHVRNRVLVSEMGRWGRRDPAFVSEMGSVLAYSASNPTMRVDPTGLVARSCGTFGAACPGTPVITVPPGSRPTGDRPTDACTLYCSGTLPAPAGGTLCVDRRPVICVCQAVVNLDLMRYLIPTSVEWQYRECIEEHERQHVSDMDCSNCNSPDGVCKPGPVNPLPWNDPQCGGPCSEYAAWEKTARCIGNIYCGTNSLCQDGRERLRQNAEEIRDQYKKDCESCKNNERRRRTKEQRAE